METVVVIEKQEERQKMYFYDESGIFGWSYVDTKKTENELEQTNISKTQDKETQVNTTCLAS